jgi:hypothetical protein
MFVDRLAHSALLSRGTESLYNSRYAYPHELLPLIGRGLSDEASLLLGILDHQTILRVTAQPKRPELNSLAVIARTRRTSGDCQIPPS